jgi:hypothetical protein
VNKQFNIASYLDSSAAWPSFLLRYVRVGEVGVEGDAAAAAAGDDEGGRRRRDAKEGVRDAAGGGPHGTGGHGHPRHREDEGWAAEDRGGGLSFAKGPSTRVRFCVRIAIQFRAQFAYKWFRVSRILRTPITSACKHISAKIDICAGNRTQNRTEIRTRVDGP